MLRIIGDFWRSFFGYCGQLRFKHRWNRLYRDAAQLPAVEGLYLSVCTDELKPRLMAAVDRTWPRIPPPIREELRRSWEVLQERWDQRKVGIALRLPVVGVFDDCFVYAEDKGAFIGAAWRATEWNDFADSGDSLFKMFDLLFLPIWSSHFKLRDEFLDLKIAREFASHLLCSRNSTKASSLLCGCHKGTDELVKSWGFPVDAYAEWYERSLYNSTETDA